jgi:hypothetical protein
MISGEAEHVSTYTVIIYHQQNSNSHIFMKFGIFVYPVEDYKLHVQNYLHLHGIMNTWEYVLLQLRHNLWEMTILT